MATHYYFQCCMRPWTRVSFRVLLAFAASLFGIVANGQEHALDGNTLLLLHLNQSLVGASGETATQSSGVGFASGVFSYGADLGSGTQLHYSAAGNVAASAGTLEFWFQPHWNGNDGESHAVFAWGLGGGMLVAKDGADNWRIIVNRFGGSGHPEVGTAYHVASAWTAESWHHCAFT